MKSHHKSCTWAHERPHTTHPDSRPQAEVPRLGTEKHHWSYSDQVVLKVRKTKAHELTYASDTWQSCTAPSKFRPEFYQGAAQQGPQLGRAMGSWRAACHSIPQQGKTALKWSSGPWVGWGGCSGPLHNFCKILY